jgi:hypothetical protein
MDWPIHQAPKAMLTASWFKRMEQIPSRMSTLAAQSAIRPRTHPQVHVVWPTWAGDETWEQFCSVCPTHVIDRAFYPGNAWKNGLPGVGRSYTGWFRQMSRVEHAEWPEVWQNWLEGAGFKLERYWHYFSPQAMRVLEWGHYFGAPTLLPHALSKRWIIAPWRWNLFLTERYVRHYAVAAPDPQGTFTFYIARRI